MAWGKDEIDQFLGGNQKADKLLSQSMTQNNSGDIFSVKATSTNNPRNNFTPATTNQDFSSSNSSYSSSSHQSPVTDISYSDNSSPSPSSHQSSVTDISYNPVPANSSYPPSSFRVPVTDISYNDDPNRYKIAKRNLLCTEAVEELREYRHKYSISTYVNLTFIIVALGCFICAIAVTPWCALGFVGCLILCLFHTYLVCNRILKEAAVYFKKTLVRSELSQHITINALAETSKDVGKWRAPDPNQHDLFDCHIDEELLAGLNIGGPKRNSGEINDWIRGRIGDTNFRFIETVLRRSYWQRRSGKSQNGVATLFCGHCIIFQTSVPIPFPVQYDHIPSNEDSDLNDFYKQFRCYQYRPETDIHAGTIINQYIDRDEQGQLEFMESICLKWINSPCDRSPFQEFQLLDEKINKEIDDIPQEYKDNLPTSDREIMDTIESEEFQNTLLGIAKILKNKKWSIRLQGDNLIFIRPNCDIFEYRADNKDMEGQISKFENDVTEFVGILEILSKLSIVRGHSESQGRSE